MWIICEDGTAINMNRIQKLTAESYSNVERCNVIAFVGGDGSNYESQFVGSFKNEEHANKSIRELICRQAEGRSAFTDIMLFKHGMENTTK